MLRAASRCSRSVSGRSACCSVRRRRPAQLSRRLALDDHGAHRSSNTSRRRDRHGRQRGPSDSGSASGSASTPASVDLMLPYLSNRYRWISRCTCASPTSRW